MKTMEMKIDEVHFMLSHLMTLNPRITGLEVMNYLGLDSLGFMDLIIEEDRFPKAINVERKASIFECEWCFRMVSSWKERNSGRLDAYKNVSGDIHGRIATSYKKVTGRNFSRFSDRQRS